MRILSVNYPKTTEDDKKINLFQNCYAQLCAKKIEREDELLKCTGIDFKAKVQTMAPFWTQIG